MYQSFKLNRKLIFIFVALAIFSGCNQHLKKPSGNKNSPTNYLVISDEDLSKVKSGKSIIVSVDSLQSISFQPGDTIFFKSGDTFAGTIKLTINGTVNDPIVIDCKGENNAIIDGKNNEALKLEGGYFQVKNLILIGSGRKSGNKTSGMLLEHVHDVWIESVQISGFQKSGLAVQNSQNIQVSKLIAKDNGAIGISVEHCKNVVIQDCLAENNPGDPTNLNNHSGNGILVGNSKNVLIDHCVATNNGWDMPRTGNGPVGIWTYMSDSITIQNCISYKNKTSEGGKDGGGFDFDGGVTNSLIQNCLSYENEGAGYGLFQYPGADNWSNNTIRYCLSIDDGAMTDGAGGIFLWNGGASSAELSDAYIYNNVVVNHNKPCVVFEPASENENILLTNNLFIGQGNLVSGPTSGEKFIGNIYWKLDDQAILFRGFKSLESWAENTGQEMWNGNLAGKVTDPMLEGPLMVEITDPYQLGQLTGYRLKKNSPLKNSGINLTELGITHLPSTDFFGNPITEGSSTKPGIYEAN